MEEAVGMDCCDSAEEGPVGDGEALVVEDERTLG